MAHPTEVEKMLSLVASGAVALWLETTGTTLPPPRSLSPLLEAPGLAFSTDTDPPAQQLVDRYVRRLSSRGFAPENQGLWLQAGTRVLASHRGTVPLPAASITKVATSLVALETWGGDRTFETAFYGTGTLNNGTLDGDLAIAGGGDPMFVWEDAIAVAIELQRQGIQRVSGDLRVGSTFSMNFKDDPIAAGTLLERAFDARQWTPDLENAYKRLSANSAKPLPKPQLDILGEVRSADDNPSVGRLLYRHRSRPLLTLLKQMNVYSNNVMAETLATQLGGGATVARRAARLAGVPPTEIQLVNGSGLGQNNRISPRAACALFAAIQRRLAADGRTVADVFPVSGRDGGTLEDRRIPKGAIVKTGTLWNVSALAGAIPTRDLGLVWFAAIDGGEDYVIPFRRAQDEFLDRLVAQYGDEVM
ncbi:D-alanyl-D-alanine carboxypeptidase [Baaleninema simplex]|uniref:D-alanyl-D-alanine carboxypeptidase n=1 Tax=Baaleninema simplex TaxID=2862350 RepID=UPI000349CE22|nr:D-alanyl-D-alanine carboxypeptidase [Baaleninema simplex]